MRSDSCFDVAIDILNEFVEFSIWTGSKCLQGMTAKSFLLVSATVLDDCFAMILNKADELRYVILELLHHCCFNRLTMILCTHRSGGINPGKEKVKHSRTILFEGSIGSNERELMLGKFKVG